MKYPIPSLDDVTNYGLSIGLSRDDCEAFFDHHSARGWKYKPGLPMCDYKAALRTWKRNAERFAKADDEDSSPKIRYMASAEDQRARRREREQTEADSGHAENHRRHAL